MAKRNFSTHLTDGAPHHHWLGKTAIEAIVATAAVAAIVGGYEIAKHHVKKVLPTTPAPKPDGK